MSRIMGVLVVGLLVLAGCASRPSDQELTDSILTAVAQEPGLDLTQAQAECIAAELLASDLSDTTLSGLAEDFDNPEVLETEVDDVEPLVVAAWATCTTVQ